MGGWVGRCVVGECGGRWGLPLRCGGGGEAGASTKVCGGGGGEAGASTKVCGGGGGGQKSESKSELKMNRKVNQK